VEQNPSGETVIIIIIIIIMNYKGKQTGNADCVKNIIDHIISACQLLAKNET
jgi:hypothetical protein